MYAWFGQQAARALESICVAYLYIQQGWQTGWAIINDFGCNEFHTNLFSINTWPIFTNDLSFSIRNGHPFQLCSWFLALLTILPDLKALSPRFRCLSKLRRQNQNIPDLIPSKLLADWLTQLVPAVSLESLTKSAGRFHEAKFSSIGSTNQRAA